MDERRAMTVIIMYWSPGAQFLLTRSLTHLAPESWASEIPTPRLKIDIFKTQSIGQGKVNPRRGNVVFERNSQSN